MFLPLPYGSYDRVTQAVSFYNICSYDFEYYDSELNYSHKKRIRNIVIERLGDKKMCPKFSNHSLNYVS